MPRAKTSKASSDERDEKPYAKPAAPKKKSKNPTNKKQGAWSSEELKALYEVMCPKRVSVSCSLPFHPRPLPGSFSPSTS